MGYVIMGVLIAVIIGSIFLVWRSWYARLVRWVQFPPGTPPGILVYSGRLSRKQRAKLQQEWQSLPHPFPMMKD